MVPGADAPSLDSTGTDLRRRELVYKLFNEALDGVVQQSRYTNLASSFPSLARVCPEKLTFVAAKLKDFLAEAIREEMDSIVQKRDLCVHLDELDKVCAEATQNPPKSVPQLNPHALTAAFRCRAKRRLVQTLSAELGKFDAKERELQSQLESVVQPLRDSQHRLQSSIELVSETVTY